MLSEIDLKAEKDRVEQTIRDCIMWPYPEKNIDRLYSSVARNSSFFIFHPDSKSTIVGFDAFQQMITDVFLNEASKATGTTIREMRINLSESGEVAWFSAFLDDYGEWQKKPYAWVNARWTGVLEKREGKWLIVQMHFSFASDARNEPVAQDSTASDKKQ